MKVLARYMARFMFAYAVTIGMPRSLCRPSDIAYWYERAWGKR